jgi:hypothetical protein
MSKEPFSLTLPQYMAERWQEFKARYPDAKRADFNYTQGWKVTDYWNAAEKAIRDGNGITATVADRCEEAWGFERWFNLYQKYPQSFPAPPYLCPSARKIQEERTREMIDARKSGREGWCTDGE